MVKVESKNILIVQTGLKKTAKISILAPGYVFLHLLLHIEWWIFLRFDLFDYCFFSSENYCGQ